MDTMVSGYDNTPILIGRLKSPSSIRPEIGELIYNRKGECINIWLNDEWRERLSLKGLNKKGVKMREMCMNSSKLYRDDLIKNDSIINDKISRMNYPTDLSKYKKPEGVHKFLPNGELGKDGLVKQLLQLYSRFLLKGKLYNDIDAYAISFMYINNVPYIIYFYNDYEQDEKYLVSMTLEGVVVDITDKRILKDKYQEYQIVKLMELTKSCFLPDLPEHITVVSDILRVKEKFFETLGEYFI